MPLSLSSVPISPADETDDGLAQVVRRFRRAERIAGLGTWRLTLPERSLEWSDQVFVIHGLDGPTAPTITQALGFYPPDSRAMIRGAIARTITTGQPYDFETDLTTASGVVRRVRGRGEIELSNGRPAAVFGVVQDITEQHAINQRLRAAAATDALTGIPNRSAFNRHLGEHIAASRSTRAPLALLLIDLDHFKAVNDAFGHLAGDDVLRDIATELRECSENDCFAARIGGDEFAMIVGGVSCARLDAIVARLTGRLCRRVRREGRTITVSASLGVAWLDDTIDNATALIARADAALYGDKRARRGRSRAGDRPTADETRRPLSIVA